MIAPLPPLDEEDFDDLDQLLAALGAEDGLRLDGAQGLLTALVVGPRGVGPETWLPVILGGEPLGVEHERLQALLRLLLRLQGSIERGLDAYAYDPILAEEDAEDASAGADALVDASGWCEGFSLGVDLQAELWEQRLHEDPALADLVAAVVALGVEDGVFAEIRDPDIAPLSEAERDDLLQHLPGVLVDLRQYWRDHPPEAAAPIGATLH